MTSAQASRDFGFCALSVPGLPDPLLPAAASRGGAVGLLDLSGNPDFLAARAAVEHLAEAAGESWGVRLGARIEPARRLLGAVPGRLPLAIVMPQEGPAFTGLLEDLRARGAAIFFEVVSDQDLEMAELAGARGVIAKGQESGGRNGERTSFVLLQRMLARTSLPVWAQGGIGLHSVAAAYCAGAAGVVLDSQIWLTRESPLPEPVRAAIGRMEGPETACIGEECGESWRVYARSGLEGVDELRHVAGALARGSLSRPERLAEWRAAVEQRIGWSSRREVWPVGEDAALAAPLADRFRTVAGVVAGLRAAAREHVHTAAQYNQLDEGSPLAKRHGTRYPIVQGPMARVSDKPAFAERVAAAGGLPILALSLMRSGEIDALLEQTSQHLAGKPWGVGLLGFAPADTWQDQMNSILTHRPTFALIAGGRPDQAQALESQGIPAYVHAPAPGLLKSFLDLGVRRFVLEGRECGGHIGPRSSFLLWDQAIEALLAAFEAGIDAKSVQVLFAGGVHDARSSSMIAAMSAPLVRLGAGVGVLLGTAYLFTKEAVETGAIVRGFQEEALRCVRTVLLESGPGHVVRCADTPFVHSFASEKDRLADAGISPEERRMALDKLNLGRLRLAAKGVVRNLQGGGHTAAERFASLPEEEQRAGGLYMMGQIAALRNQTCTIQELHAEIAAGGSQRVREICEPLSAGDPAILPRPCDVAIIGMSCHLPGASDLPRFWSNILEKVNAITEVPPDRWDWRKYYHEDPNAPDKIYSRWGGFLEGIVFDPLRYGLPPGSIPSIEPLQLLTLEAVRAALEDAGYAKRPFARERTSVVLGAGGGAGDHGQRYVVRSALPLAGAPSAESLLGLPEWTEDTFPGILPNLTAGRVANLFDLGGVNCTVDAACASSLAAVYVAVRELQTRAADMVITGGVDTSQSPFAFLCFSKTRALSPRGRCSPFDDHADGTVISEGLAMLVLKRLADAERDGDRIYAVLKGVAGSSDGRGKGLTAPRREGQVRALERAYSLAGVPPATIGLVEAHGTGTAVGDQVEIESLTEVYRAAGAESQTCAVGSVKSMIGHTKCAAGVAGMIKAALALHYKVLPPTLGVEQPNSKVFTPTTPLFVNTEARPWIARADRVPRRAAVSAFGFGGANYHAVLEEYSEAETPAPTPSSEVFLIRSDTRPGLRAMLRQVLDLLGRGARPALRDLGHTMWRASRKAPMTAPGFTLGLAAASLDGLRRQLEAADQIVASPEARPSGVPGLYFYSQPLADAGRLAFVFSGQGSQYPGMLAELAMRFREVRERFELADRILAGRFPRPLSSYIFPTPAFGEEQRESARAELARTDIAQSATGAADLALLGVLKSLGVRPDMVAGHSYGELAALCAADVFSEAQLYALSEARGRFIREAGGEEGAMAAVGAGPDRVASTLGSLASVWLANLNGPRQTIVSGTKAAIAQAVALLESAGIPVRPLGVTCAFHSPLVAGAEARLREYLSGCQIDPPGLPVFSNMSASVYPSDAEQIAALLSQHLVRPVDFTGQIEAMYEAGARIFVEVGPGNVLSTLIGQILAGRPHAAIALDRRGTEGALPLHHAIAQLAAHGVPVQLDGFYGGESARELDLSAAAGADAPPPPATAWLVNGTRSRPFYPQHSEVGRVDGPSAPLTGAEPGPEMSRLAPVQEIFDTNLPPMPDSATEASLIEFQRIMKEFLETQREVMLAYLGRDRVQPEQSLRSPMSATSAAPGTAEERPCPPQTAAETPAPPPKSAPAARDVLLRIVSDCTGYPIEALDLDKKIESELGIDSLKTVEILTKFEQTRGPDERTRMGAAMGELTTSGTLRGMLDVLDSVLTAPPSTPDCTPASDKTAPSPAHPVAVDTAGIAAPRFVIEAAGAPAVSGTKPVSGNVLITDDEQGLAEAFANELEQRGGCAAIVRHGPRFAEGEGRHYTADLADPDAVARLLEAVRHRLGGLSGIVHLLPHRRGPALDGMDSSAWNERVRADILSLFLLAKGAAADLRANRGYLASATAMGGDFGLGEDAILQPAHGGVAGIVKTLALEWPEVRCKVVDFGSGPAEEIVPRLFDELMADDHLVEVGYRRLERVTPRPVPAERNGRAPCQNQIGPESVILITGGARGITAQVARELARWRPTLVLAGRTPFPESDEAPLAAGIESPNRIKAALFRSAPGGAPPSPVWVEEECRRLLRDRELRQNVEAMKSAGASVRYCRVDVRDEAALAGLIRDTYETYGRIDGVLHGAGIVEDRLIEDKAPESFLRVLDTKVKSAFALSKALSPETLRFLVFFSSVASCLGNQGQTDYAAANEVLNKLALHLRRRWRTRVFSVLWGPWAQVGMVSPLLEKRFLDRGIDPISPADGAQALVWELCHGRTSEDLVILGDGPWNAARQSATPAPVSAVAAS